MTSTGLVKRVGLSWALLIVLLNVRPALALLIAVGCGRFGFDESSFDAAVGTRDASAVADAAADSTGETVSCAELAPILANQPGGALIEPTAYVDGLRVLVRPSNGALLRDTTRPTPLGAFGPLSPTTVINVTVQDPTFLDGAAVGAGTIAMAAGNFGDGGDRTLAVCDVIDVLAPCDAVTILDDNGIELLGETDGPTLAVRDGAIVLAFNRGLSLFTGLPNDTSLLSWTAAPVASAAALDIDDPALTADGELLFVAGGVAPVFTLYVLHWDSASGEFGAPSVVDVDPSVASPSVGLQNGDSFELFVSADTRGIREPHRLICTSS